MNRTYIKVNVSKRQVYGEEFKQTLIAYIKEHPEETYKDVSVRFNTHYWNVLRWVRQAGLPKRSNGTANVRRSDDEMIDVYTLIRPYGGTLRQAINIINGE